MVNISLMGQGVGRPGDRDPLRQPKGPSYPGLEIIAKLATVLEVEPGELLRVRGSEGTREIR